MRIFLLFLWIIFKVCVQCEDDDDDKYSKFCDSGLGTPATRQCFYWSCKALDDKSECNYNHECCECESQFSFLTTGFNPTRKQCLPNNESRLIESSKKYSSLRLHRPAVFYCTFYLYFEMLFQITWDFLDTDEYSPIIKWTRESLHRKQNTVYYIVNATLTLEKVKSGLHSFSCNLARHNGTILMTESFYPQVTDLGTYSSTCDNNDDCDDTLLLSCVPKYYTEKQCQCKSDMHWDGSTCRATTKYPTSSNKDYATIMIVCITIGSAILITASLCVLRCLIERRKRSRRNNANLPHNNIPQFSNEVPSVPNQVPSQIPISDASRYDAYLQRYPSAPILNEHESFPNYQVFHISGEGEANSFERTGSIYRYPSAPLLSDIERKNSLPTYEEAISMGNPIRH